MNLRTPFPIELEVVRVADGQPGDLVWDFYSRLTPWRWLLSAVLAGTAAGAAVFYGPPNAYVEQLRGHYCGCGGYRVHDQEREPAPPDSTTLVRAPWKAP